MNSDDDLTVENAWNFLRNNHQREIPCDLLVKLQNASDRMHPESLRAMGYFYEHGISCEKDVNRAFSFYKVAASHGSASCLYNVAVMLFDDNKYSNLITQFAPSARKLEAIRCWEKAASMGDSYAHVALGIAYENGDTVSKDITKAKQLYGKAMEMGNTESAFRLALLCHRAENGTDQARKCFERACELGHPLACYKLGEIVQETVPEKYAAIRESLQYFLKAADGGVPEALEWCGEILGMGLGVPKDPQRAIAYLRKAIEANRPRAKYIFAILLARGVDISRDLPTAYKFAIEAKLAGIDAAARLAEKLASQLEDSDLSSKGG